ncbi:uncharacterized protein [Argopecten irradians]|uniref:uncharacterized protein n=1 Tax=Argopecten irradians TaxID=31199 RepID=UPI003718038E
MAAATMKLIALVLMIGLCHGHFHFKSLLRNVVAPEIKEKLADDLKHLSAQLPKSVSGLHISDKDLDKLKPALNEIKDQLNNVPGDLQHLDSNIKDGVSDLKPLLKALEKEVLEGMRLKTSKNNCACLKYLCTCCAHVAVKEIDLDDTICVGVAYLPKDIGVQFTLSVNGRTFINQSISVTNPPPICIAIPGLKKDASVCIRFTELRCNRAERKCSGCISLEASLLHIFKEDVKIGCFNIPLADSASVDHKLEIAASKNGTQINKEDQQKMLSRLGLMGKTYKNGRLINNSLLNN